jgi:hypothetical protein
MIYENLIHLALRHTSICASNSCASLPSRSKSKKKSANELIHFQRPASPQYLRLLTPVTLCTPWNASYTIHLFKPSEYHKLLYKALPLLMPLVPQSNTASGSLRPFLLEE